MSGTIVCDLDGVVYLGDELVPGTDRALADLRAKGWQTLFCTNNSSRSPEQVAEKLRRLTGLPIQPNETVSSAQAAARLLATRVQAVFVVGGPGVYAALAAEGLLAVDDWREAEAVVVGLVQELSYELLRDAALAVRAGAWFVATNLDPSYPTPGGLWPGAGAIVAAISATADRQPDAAGKPFRPMIDLVESRIAADGPVIMVGDRPSTDLALGKAAGWITVGVLTGVIASADEVPSDLAPNALLASLAELPAWVGDHLEREVQ